MDSLDDSYSVTLHRYTSTVQRFNGCEVQSGSILGSWLTHGTLEAQVDCLIVVEHRLIFASVRCEWAAEDPPSYSPCKWLRLDMVPMLHFFSVSLILLLEVLGFLLIQLGLMRNSERLGFPILVAEEVDGWLPLLPVISLSELTGEMLVDVVSRKEATAGSIDGWDWRELKVLPVVWCDSLARILSKVEESGGWPESLLDVHIALIPKADGDATQRPLSVLPVVYRIWASARMVQLEGWFQSWVLGLVFCAGGGRSSVEAWFSIAQDIEEVLSGAAEPDIHLFVADVIKSFDTVDRAILGQVLSSLRLLA